MIPQKNGFDGLSPYVAGKPIEEVQREYGLAHVTKLASNENPMGAGPLARQAIVDTAQDCFRYPDGACHALREKLAAHVGISADHLVFGTGSDGLIELTAKTFLAPGDEAVMSQSTFSLYHTNTVAAGATPVEVPLTGALGLDLAAFAHAITPRTRVVWLCNPNNPTGTLYTQAEQDRLLDAIPPEVLVVVDEAYFEYARECASYPDTIQDVRKRNNVLVLRTFSKIYGLAGLRVGYGIGSPDIITEMEKVRAPFNVSIVAQAAACASLDDHTYVADSLKLNRENYTYLTEQLQNRKVPYVPSYANFVLVDVGMDSAEAQEQLLRRGVIVKAGAPFGLPHHIRVSVGTREECDDFLRALGDFL